jgi:molybdate transport system substrate-binding protein
VRSWITILCAGALALGVQASPACSQSADLTIFAAASLKNSLDAVAGAYREATGRRVAVSYGASSALAKQIEAGAPADIFLAADGDWMDHLQERNLIRPSSRRNLLGNRIVLVAPAAEASGVSLAPRSIAAALGGGRLAIANVSAVPAGKYGKAALVALGLWPEAEGRLAQAENVRAALAFVARGEAPLGLVYETDAKAEPKVAVVARFPETSHPPIVYPVAVTASSASPDATPFLDSLRSPQSAALFAREGFILLE